MKRTYLGEFEEVVLLTTAILALQQQAYGVAIAHEIMDESGRDVRLNQIHAALQRLEEKGMVESQMGDPTPERGGRRKRLFTVTAFGQRTLAEIQAVRTNLWSRLQTPTTPIMSV